MLLVFQSDSYANAAGFKAFYTQIPGLADQANISIPFLPRKYHSAAYDPTHDVLSIINTSRLFIYPLERIKMDMPLMT
jgi:hypothetical protein